MKILVTGGAGFIGSALCRRLNRLGEDLVVIDSMTYAASEASLAEVDPSRGYVLEKVDIRDQVAVTTVFDRSRPEAVIHLAAESHVDRSITDAGSFVTTNVVGTYVMLDAARRYWEGLEGEARSAFRFIHVSTDEVYGSLGADDLFAEQTAYDPRSPYSASKAGADHLASAWWHTYGLPVIISNCSNNYGPYQFPEKLIPLTILNAIHGDPISVYGDGGNIRDWLYVEDHCAALDLILRRAAPGSTYNIGGHNERTNLQVVETICTILDRLHPVGAPHRDLIRFVADRPGHDRRYAIDSTRLQTDLGWLAADDFDTGLEKTVRWYLERRDWWEPLRQRYAGQRLGLGGPNGAG